MNNLPININPSAVSITVGKPKTGVAFSPPVVRDYSDIDTYTGTYEITPTQETQTLSTQNMRMAADVVINPIPSNYGLVTWNGAVLTVS